MKSESSSANNSPTRSLAISASSKERSKGSNNAVVADVKSLASPVDNRIPAVVLPVVHAPSYMSPTKASVAYARLREPIGITSSAVPKKIYFIRHGESLGQVANKWDRKRSPELRDCGLSPKGILQAKGLERQMMTLDAVDVVISSPLTRAVHTAVLGFPSIPIVIHYDLAELGSYIPENRPLPIADVWKRVKKDCSCSNGLDGTFYGPAPSANDKNTPQRVLRAMKELAQRPELTMAIVCHFGVIRTIFQDLSMIPINATPIVGILYPNGQVTLHPD